MASIKEIISQSLSNFSNSLKKTYIKIDNIVDNLVSTNTDLPLSANQGKILNDKINKINSTIFTVPINGYIIVQIRDVYAEGNLVLLYNHFVIPDYKFLYFASTGNGNNTNVGQNVTLIPILESKLVTVERVNKSGKYNQIKITNNGSYNTYLRVLNLAGTSATLISTGSNDE